MTDTEKSPENEQPASDANQAQNAEIGQKTAKSDAETAPTVEQSIEQPPNPPSDQPESDETPPAPPPDPDEPKKKKGPVMPERDPNTNQFKQLDITQQQAFDRFMRMPITTTVEHYQKVLEQEMGKGKAPSLSTMKKWSARYKWLPRRTAAIEGKDPLEIRESLDSLKGLNEHVSPEIIDGLIARTMHSIDNSMASVVVSTPSDLGQQIKNLESLIKVKATYRHMLRDINTEDDNNTESGPVLSEGSEPAPDRPTIGNFKENISKGGEVK